MKKGEKQGTPSAPGEGDARGGPAKRQREADPGRGGETSKKAFLQAKTLGSGREVLCTAL